MPKMTKKAQREQAVRIATIYNKSITPTSVLRAESEAAIAKFLKSGGVIEQGRKLRTRKGSKMASKSSKGFVTGTSGFATGYPRKSTGAV